MKELNRTTRKEKAAKEAERLAETRSLESSISKDISGSTAL